MTAALISVDPTQTAESMDSTSIWSVLIVVGGLVLAALFSPSSAGAVGVLYADPGWFYAYDGNEAFYNDLDGPNPDYINGSNQNAPGGQNGTPGLVDPRVLDPGCNPSSSAGNCANAEWIYKKNQWDGSAPGDPLGDVPSGIPPLLPAVPGGVATYAEAGTGATYLRIQDPGNPNTYGWADKGAQAGPTAPRQEGSGRQFQVGHDMTVDPQFSGNHNILDNGVTISFRTRLATLATGPLDDAFPEGGTTLADTVPWPTDGLGYSVANEGRGMFHLSQSGPGGEQQMAFGLVDQDTITTDSLTITKTGLVMNNRANPAVADDVDTNMANDTTLNVVEIPDADLDDWHEFWITIEALTVPVAGNTHEVNVYHNGSLTPETFEIILARENEFDTGAHLGMGLSSATRQGAYDVDFYAYSEGSLTPALVADADFDNDGDVDGRDFLLIQRGDPSQIPLWESDFGDGGGPLGALSSVPEPTSLLLLLTAATLLCGGRIRSEIIR
jgi:hypothetical protein